MSVSRAAFGRGARRSARPQLRANPSPRAARPLDPRSPSLNFHADGVWYYGTYALNNYVPGVNPGPDCGNWCVQCPFDGIRFSRDNSVGKRAGDDLNEHLGLA